MLDRVKLLRELQNKTDGLFVDMSTCVSIARASWQRIIADDSFVHKARCAVSPWSIPMWEGNLDQSYEVIPLTTGYTAISVDGSQIYPDKHQGTSCFLINVGLVELTYGVGAGGSVKFLSEPYVFGAQESDDPLQSAGAVDLVNCRRQEFEFLAAYERCKEFGNQEEKKKPVLLFDGSLIFWHLEAKEPEVKHQFLTSYLASLQQLYEARILLGGYISMPKSKDLVNLIRLELCNFDASRTQAYKEIDALVDASVAYFFLEPFSRSILFQSTSPITDHYPDHLRPYFFYLHVGNEIARIEIPAWIAQDERLVEHLSAIMLDQTLKGRGYPVALAEAHEQAVVKGPDREFFYHLIQKIGIEQNRRLHMSPKSMKKRGIGI